MPVKSSIEFGLEPIYAYTVVSNFMDSGYGTSAAALKSLRDQFLQRFVQILGLEP